MDSNINNNEYLDLLNIIKDRVKTSQIKAHLSVNQELICMHWHTGKEILDRQNKYGWGSKVIDNLSRDLTLSFPNMKGFSVRNLKYMRQFAEFYSDFEFVQMVSAQLTWWHNINLMQIKDKEKKNILYTKDYKKWLVQKCISSANRIRSI